MFKNRIILSLCTFAFLTAFTISFVSCEQEEEEDVVLSRLFRPGSFSRIVNGTDVALSWIPIKNATYLIEYGRLASGLPFDSIKDKQTIELERGVSSYQLYELWGSTRYGIRIKAVSTIPETEDSEWATSNFTTGAENIFYPLTYEPAGNDFRIFVKWIPEKTVTHILINNLQLGEKLIPLSNAEITVGEKIIESVPEYRLRNGQQYIISIWFNERKRGENSVTLQR